MITFILIVRLLLVMEKFILADRQFQKPSQALNVCESASIYFSCNVANWLTHLTWEPFLMDRWQSTLRRGQGSSIIEQSGEPEWKLRVLAGFHRLLVDSKLLIGRVRHLAQAEFCSLLSNDKGVDRHLYDFLAHIRDDYNIL